MRHMLGLTKHLQEYFTGFTIQVQRRNFRYSIDNSVNCSLYSQMCIGLKCILDIENYGYSVNERHIDTYSIETLSHACSVRKNHQHTTTYTYLLCICRWRWVMMNICRNYNFLHSRNPILNSIRPIFLLLATFQFSSGQSQLAKPPHINIHISYVLLAKIHNITCENAGNIPCSIVWRALLLAPNSQAIGWFRAMSNQYAV